MTKPSIPVSRSARIAACEVYALATFDVELTSRRYHTVKRCVSLAADYWRVSELAVSTALSDISSRIATAGFPS
jgi:hypothetical protein